MNEIKFTQELKDKWLDALKSGKYKHGKGLLKTNDNCYCCLGVLCDVAGIEISPDGTECIKDDKKIGYEPFTDMRIKTARLTEVNDLSTSTNYDGVIPLIEQLPIQE